MDKEVIERFERIERNLDVAGERIAQITASHIELEAAQRNSNKVMDRLEARSAEVTEQIADLRILVDQLINKDLGGTRQ